MKYIDIDTLVANGGSRIPLSDSEEVGTEKMLRNGRIRLELQDKAARQGLTDAMTLVRTHQERLQKPKRKKMADFKAAEEAKQLPRAFAWLMVLAGAYYIPALFGHWFEITPMTMTVQAAMFWIWACIWCFWGYEQIMWMANGSFAVLILLWVIPFYICGPTLYLWDSYTESQLTKRKEGIA
jgi:hypothetical protein